MGDVLGIYTSILTDVNGDIEEKAFRYSFGHGRSVAFSDHFNRYDPENLKKGIILLDNTFLLFDVNTDSIRVHDRAQGGSVQKNRSSYSFTIELSLERTEFSNVYCLILPDRYVPINFIDNKPHFAALVNGRIRMTWIFENKLKVRLQFKKDLDKYRNYKYIEEISFFEKHPAAKKYYNEAMRWFIQFSVEMAKKSINLTL